MSKPGNADHELPRRSLRGVRPRWRGVVQADVARYAGVTRTTRRDRIALSAAGGLGPLARRPREWPAGLDVAQRNALVAPLTAGAIAAEFATESKPLPHAQGMSKKPPRLAYSRQRVRLVIQLDFCSHRHSERGLELDGWAIKQWNPTRWPVLNDALPGKTEPSSSSPSRASGTRRSAHAARPRHATTRRYRTASTGLRSPQSAVFHSAAFTSA